MWKVKTEVISVTKGVTGTISKTFIEQVYLSNVLGKHEIKGVHQRATFGTAHKFSKFLIPIQKYKGFKQEKQHYMCHNCNYRLATIYTLRDIVCFKHINVKTPHKGDNKDNNNNNNNNNKCTVQGRTRPDRPWCPPRLLYNGYQVFPGGKATGAWC